LVDLAVVVDTMQPSRLDLLELLIKVALVEITLLVLVNLLAVAAAQAP
jgi:hypothetical protein